MNTYNLKTCEDLISKYVGLNGDVTTVRDGILGMGTVVLHGVIGKKSIIINEVYLNANSSGHTIRMYNKLPKKYEKLIGDI